MTSRTYKYLSRFFQRATMSDIGSTRLWSSHNILKRMLFYYSYLAFSCRMIIKVNKGGNKFL
ncbi:hypothetical protein GCM10010896_18120 [Mammaliicoccus stepanovicii]|nr:hypothetical protein GCM10010896_18120 [Mammaliicoccus stepanovicii]